MKHNSIENKVKLAGVVYKLIKTSHSKTGTKSNIGFSTSEEVLRTVSSSLGLTQKNISEDFEMISKRGEEDVN